MIGRAWFAGSELRVETNSLARADALREQIEQACGSHLRHRGRVHADPRAPRPAGEAAPLPEPAPPEVQQLALDFKERHYADWPDIPVPALGDRTPREAARTAQGRRDLEVLLKEMENMEARSPVGERFDFGALRRELGLDAD